MIDFDLLVDDLLKGKFGGDEQSFPYINNRQYNKDNFIYSFQHICEKIEDLNERKKITFQLMKIVIDMQVQHILREEKKRHSNDISTSKPKAKFKTRINAVETILKSLQKPYNKKSKELKKNLDLYKEQTKLLLNGEEDNVFYSKDYKLFDPVIKSPIKNYIEKINKSYNLNLKTIDIKHAIDTIDITNKNTLKK